MKQEQNALEQARKQAEAQMQSVRDLVAALAVDYDRLEELREARAPWVAGWNMAGYMPDSEPDNYESRGDAREAVITELRERAEQDEESADHEEQQDDIELAETLRLKAREYEAAAIALEGSESEDEESVTANNWAFWIARAEYEGLTVEEHEELTELEAARGDCEDRDDAEQRIHNDALSVEVRSDWITLDQKGEIEPADFRIVLCTGGPHVQIRGTLDAYGEPERAWLEYQDWFTGLIERPNQAGDQDDLLTYAGCFYFGE